MVKPDCVVMGGTNKFFNCDTLIAFNGQTGLAFKLQDGVPLVTFIIQEPLACETAIIEDNRLVSGSAVITQAGTSVRVMQGPYPALVARGVGRVVEVDYFDLRPYGFSLTSDTTRLKMGGHIFTNLAKKNLKVAIFLGPH